MLKTCCLDIKPILGARESNTDVRRLTVVLKELTSSGVVSGGKLGVVGNYTVNISGMSCAYEIFTRDSSNRSREGRLNPDPRLRGQSKITMEGLERGKN